MARYEIWLCNDHGTRIADIWGHTMLERGQSFTATRISNDVGTFTVDVPPTFDKGLLRRDLIMQVWRAADGAALNLFRAYFLRRWTLETKRGRTLLELQGRDANDLLRRRVVRAAPGTPHALKGWEFAVPTDDIMKELVRESQDDGGGYGWPGPTYGSRAWANFSVEADSSAGPDLGYRDLDLSYEYLLNDGSSGALSQVAGVAAIQGDEVFFDVVPLVLTGREMTFIFRTRKGQPGQDITSHGVLFSQDRGNLTTCSLTYDYTREENAIWGVKEQGAYNTVVRQQYSRVDHDASIWNRCEGIIDISAQSARSYLREKRGRINFVGTIIDTDGMRFGVDWHYGDRARMRYQNFQFDTIIRAVTIGVDKRGKEIVSARLEYQADA